MNVMNVKDVGAVEAAADILLNGGVVAIPTETVYGLAALWDCAEAREKIYELKRRPAEKRLQMLAADLSSAKAAGLLDDARLEKIACRFWPGALTVVARAVQGDSIGLRIPAHPFVLALLRRLGRPLACTSANLSGQPAGVDAQSAVAGLCGEPDGLVDGGSVTASGGQASTVLSLLGEAPVILRQGPIGLDDILRAIAP